MAQPFIYAALIASVFVSHAASQEVVAKNGTSASVAVSAAVRDPAQAPPVEPVADGRSRVMPSQELVSEIAHWLVESIGMKPSPRPPKIAIVSANEALFLRYKAFTAEKQREVLANYAQASGGGIAGVYDPRTGTITLVEGWTGHSPAETSILVHEMVHHFQYEAGMRFACPQESESLAYAAQDQWLRRFGLDLESEFNLDPFTRLALTLCPY